MEQSLLVQLFKMYMPLISDDELAYIMDMFEPMVFTKSTVFLEHGSTTDHIFFIENGIVREVDITTSKKRNIRGLWGEGNFFYVIDSYHTHKPSPSNLETIGPATLWAVHRDNAEKLYMEFPAICYLSLKQTERHVLKNQNYLEVLRKEPEERVLWFEEFHWELKNRVPLKDIASYLHITPETLSRVRNHWAQSDNP